MAGVLSPTSDICGGFSGAPGKGDVAAIADWNQAEEGPRLIPNDVDCSIINRMR